MTMRAFLRRKTAVLLAVFGLMLLGGCRRSEEVFDDRTLEKRPHVETVKPEDRKDAFRP